MLWSYTLAAIGILGIWLAGRRNLWGWAIGLGSQFLWIAYAFATGQYGFLVSALGYGTVYARNWLRWRKENSAQPIR